MTLKELLKQKYELEAQMGQLASQVNEIQMQIDEMLSQRLVDLRKMQGKDFGAIHLTFEGLKVTETVPKKVEWDQEKLVPLFFKIMESGDKPSDYMRMKLDIPEKMYSDFPPQIKTIFDEARTVKAGRPTLKFEEVV